MTIAIRKTMIIKVCGLREPDNIRAVDALGADMTGFIFYERSPRNIDEARMESVRRVIEAEKAAGCAAERVGVFVNRTPEAMAATAGRLGLDCIQLHGGETTDVMRSLRRRLDDTGLHAVRLIKALPVSTADDARRGMDYCDEADMLLFDTKGKAVGGNGVRFDWAVLDAYRGSKPFLLSGGIGPDDASGVAAFAHPRMAGVDLNSRFETSPAVKDVPRLRAFIDRLLTAEHQKQQ